MHTQVAMWAWTPPPETSDTSNGIGPEPEEDARSRAVQQQVIGRLVQPVEVCAPLLLIIRECAASHQQGPFGQERHAPLDQTRLKHGITNYRHIWQLLIRVVAVESCSCCC